VWPAAADTPPEPDATAVLDLPAKVPALAAAWPAPQMRPGRPASGTPDGHKPRVHRSPTTRSPAAGLAALLLLALLAGFFGWVSADPFWVALGHAERGTATVTRCTGNGIAATCVGTFTGSRFSAGRVRLAALPDSARHGGATVTVRMVSATSRIAYAGRPGPLHARWLLGVALVLLCGLGIAWSTGVTRLPAPARPAIYGTSLAAPLILFAGFLAATF
jgi:hypothetical protein